MVNTDVSFRGSSVLQCCTLVEVTFVFNYTPNIHKLSKLGMGFIITVVYQYQVGLPLLGSDGTSGCYRI